MRTTSLLWTLRWEDNLSSQDPLMRKTSLPQSLWWEENFTSQDTQMREQCLIFGSSDERTTSLLRTFWWEDNLTSEDHLISLAILSSRRKDKEGLLWKVCPRKLNQLDVRTCKMRVLTAGWDVATLHVNWYGVWRTVSTCWSMEE
jgi:hypothetical protein